MKIKEREPERFFHYLKTGFSAIVNFLFGGKKKKVYYIIFTALIFIVGLVLGLLAAGYFGTFDQPSGKLYSLMVSLGIDNPHNLRILAQGVIDENIKIPINYIRGQLSNPDKFIINIKFTDYQKLEYKRQEALNLGVLVSSGDDFVPAEIIYNGKTYFVKLRLKGDLPDHWKGDKWSLRVEVKNDTIMGMSVFSLQDPATRQELNEMIYQQTLREEGVIGLRYNFVEVLINGENKGIYAMEEHFTKELIENNSRREGVIVKFGEDVVFENSALRSSLDFNLIEDFYGSPVEAFESEKKITNDPVKLGQFETAFGILENFRKGTIKPHEAFDVDKTARYYAVSTLMNCPHSKTWHNVRIYYNPITSLLEPVGFDGNCRLDGSADALKEYVPDCIYSEDGNFECSFKESDFSDLVLSDSVIFERYMQELEKISNKKYLDNLFSKLDGEIQRASDIIHKKKPFYHFSREAAYNGQTQIRDMLNIIQGVNSYYEENLSSPAEVFLAVGNINPLPIEILGLDYNGTVLPLSGPTPNILQPRNISKLPDYKAIGFKIPPEIEWSKDKILLTNISYKIFGTTRVLNSSIFAWSYAEEDFVQNDFIRQKSDLSSFEMLDVNDITKVITIKQGNWNLNENLIIPGGFLVIAQGGTNIDLTNGATILSHSRMNLIGDEGNPIKMFSSDGTGQGLTILGNNDSSYLKNVVFDGLTNPSKEGWELTGAINIHNANVQIRDTSFLNAKSEDSLNIVNSKIEIKNSLFQNSFSDCLDLDFSDGTIEDTGFKDCGNDGLDFSGSEISLSAIKVIDAGDKGISVGERSKLNGKDIIIFGKSLIGVASKDLSEVFLDGVNISGPTYGLAVYQKKPEYGPSSLIATKADILGIENDYLVEKNSALRVNGIIILSNGDEIFKKLYGVL